MRERSFVFYQSYYEAVMKIKDKEVQCRVLCFILEYGLYGRLVDMSDIEDPDGGLSMVLAAIKNEMDAHKAERERMSKQMGEMGKKGGAQKGNQNARKHFDK